MIGIFSEELTIMVISNSFVSHWSHHCDMCGSRFSILKNAVECLVPIEKELKKAH